MSDKSSIRGQSTDKGEPPLDQGNMTTTNDADEIPPTAIKRGGDSE